MGTGKELVKIWKNMVRIYVLCVMKEKKSSNKKLTQFLSRQQIILHRRAGIKGNAIIAYYKCGLTLMGFVFGDKYYEIIVVSIVHFIAMR